MTACSICGQRVKTNLSIFYRVRGFERIAHYFCFANRIYENEIPDSERVEMLKTVQSTPFNQ